MLRDLFSPVKISYVTGENKELTEKVKKAKRRVLAVIGEGRSYERAIEKLTELIKEGGEVAFVIGPSFDKVDENSERLDRFLGIGAEVYLSTEDPIQHYAVIDDEVRIEDPHTEATEPQRRNTYIRSRLTAQEWESRFKYLIAVSKRLSK